MARKVNTKITQRARKHVRANPKRVTEDKDKPRKKTPKNPSKPSGRAVKSLGGRGLAKAVKLKRRSAIKKADNGKKGTDRLPLLETRLTKYQPKAQASKTNRAKQRLPGLSQLILRAVSQSQHRGGVTMAALKQVLTDGGYDVTKNKHRVSVTLKGLVAKEILLQTARPNQGAGSYKLNKMNLAGEKKMKTKAVRTTKGTGPGPRAGKAKKTRKQSKSPPVRKSPKQARKSLTNGKKGAGKQMGRKTMLATKAKKQTARKGKTTRKAKSG